MRDQLVRKVGPEKFREKIKTALPLVDFFFQKIQKETEINSLAGKTRFAYMAEKYLSELPKGIFQELMYERLSQMIGVNLEKVDELLHPQKHESKKKLPQKIETKGLLPPLKLAISLLLQNPALLNKLEIPADFDAVQLNGISLLRRLISLIKQHTLQTTGMLLEYLTEEDHKDLLLNLAAQDLLIPEDAWQSELQGAIYRIIDAAKEDRIQALLAKGKKDGLSPEEKQLLQSLLIEKA